MSFLDFEVPPAATGGIMTIGNFDGVHRGHQSMLRQVQRIAADARAPAVVVTFDPHPIQILKPEIRLPRLTDIETRTQLLRKYGADEVVVLPTSTDLLRMQPEEFFEEVILEKLDATGLVEGPDFRFGKDRRGDTDLLRRLCSERGLSLTVIGAVRHDGGMISSSRIRAQLESGEFDNVVSLLGHPYTLRGKVTEGAGRGRELGYPTANLTEFHPDFLLPTDGVYAGLCVIGDEEYAAAISIGTNATFGETARKVECHFIGYHGRLYDQTLSVDIVRWIRSQQTFEGREALVAAIEADIAECRSGR